MEKKIPCSIKLPFKMLLFFTRSVKEVKIDETCLIHGRLDAGDAIMKKKKRKRVTKSINKSTSGNKL